MNMTGTGSPVLTAASPGPRSLDRAFALLEHLADAGGPAGLAQLARSSGLPAGTVHRIMRSLLDAGFARQDASRRYWLGARLVRLGEAAGGDIAHRAQPLLTALVQEFGETASLAMLDGDWVTYLAQVPSPHSMRSSADPGRRAPPYCTAVGKALLSRMPDETLHALIRRTGMPALTQHTITTEQALAAEIGQIRANGYAVDNEEQELGLRCVAVPVDWPGAGMAISVSGPTCRIGAGQLDRIVPALRYAASGLAAGPSSDCAGTRPHQLLVTSTGRSVLSLKVSFDVIQRVRVARVAGRRHRGHVGDGSRPLCSLVITGPARGRCRCRGNVRYLQPDPDVTAVAAAGVLCAFPAWWTHYLNAVSAAGPVRISLSLLF